VDRVRESSGYILPLGARVMIELSEEDQPALRIANVRPIESV